MNPEAPLLPLMAAGHQAAAVRLCASTVALKVAYHGNGNHFPAAMAAACATLGGTHAPIEQTMAWLSEAPIPSGIIPGFGCSFEKGHPDPAWEAVEQWWQQHPFEPYQRMSQVQDHLHSAGKKVYPNAATYTSLWALHEGLTPNEAIASIVAWRAPVWARICTELT